MKTTISPKLRGKGNNPVIKVSIPTSTPRVTPISISMPEVAAPAVDRSLALTQLHTPDYRKHEKELEATLPKGGLKLELNIARDLILAAVEAYRCGKIKSAMTLFANACTASDVEEFVSTLECISTPEQGAGQDLSAPPQQFPEILPAKPPVEQSPTAEPEPEPEPEPSCTGDNPPPTPTTEKVAPTAVTVSEEKTPTQIVVNISGSNGLRSISTALAADVEDPDEPSSDTESTLSTDDLSFDTTVDQEAIVKQAEDIAETEGLTAEDVLSEEDSDIPNEKMSMRVLHSAQ